MALKTFNPTTPSQRQLVSVDRRELWKGKPLKALTEGLRGKGGRNNTGRTTVRWRGGGHKRRYRIIDFKRGKTEMTATAEPAAKPLHFAADTDRVDRAHFDLEQPLDCRLDLALRGG